VRDRFILFFFAPADGVILHQRVLDAADPLLEIKGRCYSLREAIRDPAFDRRCLVIGIFMTFYDVHVNRIPFTGLVSCKLLPPIDSYNRPMLAVEEALLRGNIATTDAEYLFSNQRMLNSIYASKLGLTYYVLQIADYDVGEIAPFNQQRNRPQFQNRRFSQIRFGSQLDLIVPLSERWSFAIPHGSSAVPLRRRGRDQALARQHLSRRSRLAH
jgi:phosphatidylserine decarboxylase